MAIEGVKSKKKSSTEGDKGSQKCQSIQQPSYDQPRQARVSIYYSTPRPSSLPTFLYVFVNHNNKSKLGRMAATLRSFLS